MIKAAIMVLELIDVSYFVHCTSPNDGYIH